MPISADTFSPEVARRALAAGAVAVNDISGGSEEMFELVAESGCGYVLMHIEGPPRVDRPWREYGDVVDHLEAWFEGRVELARELGVAEEQIAIDPGLDFDLSPEQDLEILRRLGELRSLGLPLVRLALAQGLHRRGAGRVLGGAAAAGRARVGDGRRGGAGGARGRRRPPHPRPLLAAGDARRRPRSSASRRGAASAIDRPARWRVCLGASAPGRSRSTRRGATGGSSPRAPRRSGGRGRCRCRSRSTRASPRRCGRAGIERLYTHQLEAFEAAAHSNLVITSGTASGKSLAFNLPVLDGIAREPKRRALYLYPTKALAQDQARKLAQLRPPGLREAIYDGDTPREERPAIRRRNNLVLTNPDMLHVGLLPHHKSWGDFLANLDWVVVDEAHTYRGVFGSHVANVLRRLRRVARAYGSEPRFLLASATIANPVELAERLVGTPFELIDDDGAPRAGREMAMWNPPLIDKATGARRSALSEAADLLAELVSQDVRTICFLKSRRGIELIQRFARENLKRARQAGAGGADRSLPRRLHAAAAARDRGAAERRRAAGGGRDRRAGAGDRRRRARRGDLRHLPRHGRQPAADVGPGGAAAARASPSTSPARTRSTSSSAATRRSSSSGRSRRRSSTTPTSRSPPGT